VVLQPDGIDEDRVKHGVPPARERSGEMTRPQETLSEKVLRAFGQLLSPISSIDSQDRVVALARDLGYQLPAPPQAMVETIKTAAAAAPKIQEALVLIANAQTESAYAEAAEKLLPAITGLVVKVRELDTKLGPYIDSLPNFAGKENFAAQFSKRLFDYLVVRYLEVTAPGAHATLTFLGIIETRPEPARAPVFFIRTLRWDRLPQLVTNPGRVAEEVYHWESGFDGDLFFQRVAVLLRAFALPGSIYTQPPKVRDGLGRTGDDATELRIPLWSAGRWPSTYAEAGLTASTLEPSGAEKKGLAIMPYLTGATSISTSPAESWTFQFVGSATFEGGIALMLRPPAKVQFKTDLLSAVKDPAAVHLEAALGLRSQPDAEYLLYGNPDASLLAVKGISVRAIADKSESGDDLAVELGIEQLRLVLSAKEGDGFLGKILPPDGIRAAMDLTVGWSTARGVYFRGSGALEITIPIHKTLGPITIDSIYLLVGVDQSGRIRIAVAVSVGALIGPVAASVERIGLQSHLSFPQNGGNLGPAQLDTPSFLFPTGAGLLVDASGIVGGGFLSFDRDEGRYDGILQLRFEDIGLTAIGLISTKLPDGSKGFALLIIIGVTFSPAIQLSFGFVLSAVGGLLAINRRMDVEVLRSGLRNGTLDSVLFPEDPVRNAPLILSNLRAAFPIEEGRYVLGPMVTIGWGSPQIISADIGIFIEIPQPIVIVLLGQIEAMFPTRDDPVVELHIDVLGELRPAKRKLSIDATLHHSKILVYTLYGDAALRWRWGDDSLFVMSLGGFHPNFRDAPSDVDLRRLTIELRSTSSFDLSCRAYQALTSNTLQFGARLDLHAEVSKASVDGYLSFDALIQFSPFSFDVDIRGGVTAEACGVSVSIKLSIGLSGPTPWDARGRASFEVCCCDIDVDFHKTWGRDDKARVPAVDPLPALLAALNRPESWATALPPDSAMVEALRSLEPKVPTATTEGTPPPPPPPPVVLAHPTGRLEVRQKVAPLGIKLDQFGNAPVAGHNEFRLFAPTNGGTPGLVVQPLDELFARAQFEEMSNKKKLSIPSFEKMQGGVSIGTDESKAYGASVPHPLAYECILVGEDQTSTPQGRAGMSWNRGKRLVRGAAARRSPLRGAGRHRFERLGVPAKVGVGEESYVVARRSDLTAVVTAPRGRTDRGMTRMEADQALDRYVAQHPNETGQLEVVPAFEVVP
jgi:hypothetical protein